MATTNINNLDALDSVINIAAADETLIKSLLEDVMDFDKRTMQLFIGQMAAEGFTQIQTGTRVTLESPTVKVLFIQQEANRVQVLTHYLVDGEFVLIGERVLPGAFTYIP